MVEQCKGKDIAELQRDVLGDREPSSRAIVCLSCCHNGLNSMWESRFKIHDSINIQCSRFKKIALRN